MEQTDKKALILTHAEKLFAEQDFDAVSVRDIAKAASVNIAMISYYFGSKEKLFEELITRKLAVSQMTLRNIASDENSSTLDKLMALVEFYVDRLMNNPHVHRMINRELTSNSRPELREQLINKISTNREAISKIMEQGIERGEIRPEADTELAVMSFFATIQYLVGSSYYCCRMFDKKSEAELFTPEFKQRTMDFFKESFKNNLLIKQ